MEEKKKREKKHYFYLRELAFKCLLDIFLPPLPHFLYYFITVYKRSKLFYCCVGIIHVPPTTPNPLSSDVKYSGLICKGV